MLQAEHGSSIEIWGDAFRVVAWNFMILTYIKNSILV